MKISSNIIDSLKSEAFVTTDEVSDAVKLLAEKIYNHPRKCRGRSYEQVFNNCFYGTIAEVGIKKLLKAENRLDIFDDKWDVTDRDTYGYDLIIDNIRIEVKTQNSKWFALPSSSFSTLRNNIAAKVLDVIITASYRQYGDGYIVKSRLIIDPYLMNRYIQTSNFNSGVWFNHNSALISGACIEME